MSLRDVPPSVDLERAVLAESLNQIVQAPIVDAGGFEMSHHIDPLVCLSR